MKTKRIVGFALLAAAVVLLVLLASLKGQGPSADGKIQVVASFYPMYDFAKQVGGDKVNVTNMTPAGAEPHDYEPTPKELAAAQNASVFIYDGATLEPWVDGFLPDFKHTAVKASDNIQLLQVTEDGTAVRDPHFWLDPVLAKQIVMNIRDGLSKASPADAAYFEQNAKAYMAKLDQLDMQIKSNLMGCRLSTVISSHDAFGYFAKRYNLNVVPIAGLSPDAEPSAGKLAELSMLARNQGIRYIFFESLASPRLANTIANEVGAQTLVFDTIEGLTDEDQKQGKDYLSVQQENLQALRTALTCQ